MKVGLLTGGGDCPGLNAVIRAVVQRVTNEGGTCVGLLEGWRGLVQKLTLDLDTNLTDGIIAKGGTILGSSRTNPFKNPESDLPALRANFKELGLDALVAIGGDDTLGVAHRLHKEFNLPTIGVPKTIDNDLMVTDFTFGFDTAVNIVTECVDRLRTTTESHRRIQVVETMGRHAGWIACFSGIAVAADYILVPEVPIDMPHVIDVLKRRRAGGKHYGIVVVSEGAKFPDKGIVTLEAESDAFGHARLGGVGNVVADQIEKQTGFETRCVVLGHLQRGGPPSAYDRVLATRFGLAAGNLVLQKRFGTMVALSGTKIIETTLADGVAATKTLDLSYYNEAAAFFR
ncbi:6-phosphofructokinase [Singulisphaera acidiphila]|uniref:Pyrophosphate--fructose 6-phosphate 1-phosphotransferase n=1 Tax=Singulisphaera acidiphila (strain ATCC BAA-1392 / DSM 18658 / VKM B-2454 / MOB10) TaxID=886293 RepID=L0DGS1_SINAD|nr:ATP-dependent 6-phosphofructokinase [Singulisphaera acidiphila]AGA28008.1 phosphofructokinase [Singulisphaera acidiphila DSM 18658]